MHDVISGLFVLLRTQTFYRKGTGIRYVCSIHIISTVIVKPTDPGKLETCTYIVSDKFYIVTYVLQFMLTGLLLA